MSSDRLTGFYLHPDSALHDTGWGHPEHQGRLPAIASALGSDLMILHGRVEQRPPSPATIDDLRLAHSPQHIDLVRGACERATLQEVGVALDPNTVVSAGSWSAALGSAGAAIEAVRAVVTGELRNAFVAARPPGHHATRDRAMGFCLFNNVAIAARWLQHHQFAERVLIIDWDVHHGNGTQDIFYTDSSVFFLSLHQSPHYPYTGHTSETGTGAGAGYTLNLPLPAHLPAGAYRKHFESGLEMALEAMRPDFILVSAGFDAMKSDPLGDLTLEPADMAWMTERAMEIADQCCLGRLVAVLEGGYAPKRLGEGVVQVVRALSRSAPPTP